MDISARLENHETRIANLEKSDAVMEERFLNICKQLEGLTKALWFLGTSIIVTLGGFFIWYIQNIR